MQHNFKILVSKIFLLTLLLTVFLAENKCIYAQVGSFGNTFVFNNSDLVISNSTLYFANNQIGSQPGIIGTERTANRGVVSFLNGANISNPSNFAHVDGYVKTSQSQLFVLPIGDNGFYRPAAVDGASPTNPIEAAYFGVSPNIAITSSLKGGNEPPLPSGAPFSVTTFNVDSTDAVSDIEYWHIVGVGNSNIQLSYNQLSKIDSITNSDLHLLTILGWNGTSWDKIASSIDLTSIFNTASTLDSGSISTTQPVNLSNYSVFTFGKNTPTPIVLSQWKASIDDNCSPYFFWETSSEINNHFFEIQQSIDTKNWHSIGKVNGYNNSSEKRQYNYYHNEKIYGPTWFRLSQTDFDGKKTYFKSIYLKAQDCNPISQANLFPVPCTNEFSIDLSPFDKHADIFIFDYNGKLINTYKQTSALATYKVESLPNGLYLVKIHQDNNINTKKLIIAK